MRARPSPASCALVVVGGVAVVHALSYSYVTSDDAFISLRYARNLADGFGPVYNLGQPPVEGYSNPLFMWLSALLIALSVPPLWAVKGMGVAALVGVVALLPRVVRELGAPRSALPALAAPALMAASPFIALWSVAGLETMFYACLVLVATLRAGVEAGDARVRWSPAAFLLVAATRAEGGMLAAVAGLAQLVVVGAGARRRAAAAWLVGFGLPAAALLALRVWYYGSWVPNTYQAKVLFGGSSAAHGAAYVTAFLAAGGLWVVLPAAVGAFVSMAGRALPRARAVGVVVLSVVMAQVGFVVLVGGDFMPGYRFLVPVYPLLCALAAVGVGVGVAKREQTTPSRAVAAVLVVVTLCGGAAWTQRSALAAHSHRFWLSHDRPWPSYVGQTDLEGTWLEAHQKVGDFIRGRARGRGVLAVTEAGVIPFYAGLETVDLLGLNDANVSAMWKAAKQAYAQGQGQAPTRHWGYDVAKYALAKRPRWVVLDGHVDATSGTFLPRMEIGTWLMRQPDWRLYARVLTEPIYDGTATGLGADRTDVVFERGARR